MESAACERYPVSTVILSNVVGPGIWALGAYVLSSFGIIWPFLYLGYCLWIEFRVLRFSCVNCYYYGKRCAFGKGRISAMLLKAGNPRKFIDRRITWKDVAPDFMVSLIPFIGGIALLTWHIEWRLIVVLAAIVALSSWGNALVRGKLACSHCKQREIGCPAAMLFARRRGAVPE